MITAGSTCTGCGACVAACPTSCIAMEERELGHVYPVVNERACIGCGGCARVCHAVKKFEQGAFKGRVFAVQANDHEILDGSSSGGAFSLLAAEVLRKGGAVYGSRWNRGHGAIHAKAASLEELVALRRSKYVYSDTTGVFERVRNDLLTETGVLFVGTPCQVAALRAFLDGDCERLTTVDLLCHGVPSSAFFEEYLCWFEKKVGKPLAEYNSRDKDVAGWSYLGSYRTEGGSTSVLPIDDPYVLTFNQGATFRECCYTCPYAGARRVGDVTLGDFWGAERLNLKIDLDGGVSVVLVGTDKGRELLECACKGRAFVKEVRFEDAARSNMNLTRPTRMPFEREWLADMYASGGFASVSSRVPALYKREIINNRIKRAIPTPIKRLVKKVI